MSRAVSRNCRWSVGASVNCWDCRASQEKKTIMKPLYRCTRNCMTSQVRGSMEHSWSTIKTERRADLKKGHSKPARLCPMVREEEGCYQVCHYAYPIGTRENAHQLMKIRVLLFVVASFAVWASAIRQPHKISPRLCRQQFLHWRTNGMQPISEGISRPWSLCLLLISSSP